MGYKLCVPPQTFLARSIPHPFRVGDARVGGDVRGAAGGGRRGGGGGCAGRRGRSGGGGRPTTGGSESEEGGGGEEPHTLTAGLTTTTCLPGRPVYIPVPVESYIPRAGRLLNEFNPFRLPLSSSLISV